MAEAMSALPYEGGLFDQPPGVLFRMEAVMAAGAQPDVAKSNLEEAKRRAEDKARGVRR